MSSNVSHSSIIDRELDSNILTNETKLKLWCPWVSQLNTPILCVHLPQNPTCGIWRWLLFSFPLGAGWNWAQSVHRGHLVHTHQGGVVLPGGNPQTGGGGTEPGAGLQRGTAPSVSVKSSFGWGKKKPQTGQFCLGKHCSLLGTELKQCWSNQGNGTFWIDPCRAGWAHNSWWQRTGVTLGCFLKFSS